MRRWVKGMNAEQYQSEVEEAVSEQVPNNAAERRNQDGWLSLAGRTTTHVRLPIARLCHRACCCLGQSFALVNLAPVQAGPRIKLGVDYYLWGSHSTTAVDLLELAAGV